MSKNTTIEPYFLVQDPNAEWRKYQVAVVDGEDPKITTERFLEHLKADRIDEKLAMIYEPPHVPLGATTFTLSELLSVFDLRATAITPLQQMDMLSTALRMCMAVGQRRGDAKLVGKLVAFAKSVENSWMSKRDIDAAMKDLYAGLEK